jgi:hypothetical protein
MAFTDPGHAWEGPTPGSCHALAAVVPGRVDRVRLPLPIDADGLCTAGSGLSVLSV